jgi:hypothetical protein
MHKNPSIFVASVLSVVTIIVTAISQDRPDPKATLTAEKQAMMRFAMMDGAWRGQGWTILPSGERHELTQTERVGPALEGSVKVIEGRGYEKDGTVGFNALAIISYDPKLQSYSMRSYAQGQVGDFAITATDDGFTWEIPAGPAKIQYTARITSGTWRETGDRIAPGQDPIRSFEMVLTRIGDTDWPSGHPIPPKIDQSLLPEDTRERLLPRDHKNDPAGKDLKEDRRRSTLSPSSPRILIVKLLRRQTKAN